MLVAGRSHRPCVGSWVALLLVCASATAQITRRTSLAPDGSQFLTSSGAGAISGDGRFVTFANVTNQVWTSAYLNDRLHHTVIELGGNFWNPYPAISADGLRVAYVTVWALADQVTIYEVDTGQSHYASINADGAMGNGFNRSLSLSADGRFVSFSSSADNLVPGDTHLPDVFVHGGLLLSRHGSRSAGAFWGQRAGEANRLASVDSSGTQGNGASGGHSTSLSGDGLCVAFDSDATNLVPADQNASTDIFVHDFATGRTSRVSIASDGTEANGASQQAWLSVDARYVAFDSYASNLVVGDTNGVMDVFVHDRQTGTTVRVSVTSSGEQGTGDSFGPTLSADGRYVAFESRGLGGIPGAFVHDLATGRTRCVSVGPDGKPVYGMLYHGALSADARYVAFTTASSLDPDDTNGTEDVYLRGPELALEVEPRSLGAGQVLTATIYEGAVGLPAALCVVGVQGIPLFVPLMRGTFGTDGHYVASGPVPPGLGPLAVSLIGVAIERSGNAGNTNEVVVSIQ